MKKIKSFFKYLCEIMKNLYLLVCMALDVIGVLVVYIVDIKISNYVYVVILSVGFVYANFKLYLNNLPEVSAHLSLLDKHPYKVLAASKSNLSIMVCYNLYICNPSSNASIVKKIKVDMVKYCNVKDEFLLNKIGVTMKEYFISNEEIFPPMEYLKGKKETKFPFIIESKKIIDDNILTVYIDIDCSNEEEYKKTIQWMNDIEIKISLTTLNNNIKNTVSYKQLISKNDLENERKKYIDLNHKIKFHHEDCIESVLSNSI